MTRLRLINNWGPHKAGDIIETASPTTVMWLVERHKVAVIEPRRVAPPAPRLPGAYAPSGWTGATEMKYMRKPKRNKMVKEPEGTKNV